jgi:DNA-binding transcriptional MocR family regulator
MDINDMSNINLYEKVADKISAMIRSGTFRTGERIPSVRQLSRQLKVSVSTVMEAYRLLEDHGLVECKPQSGYYVISSLASDTAGMEQQSPSPKPANVSINELVMMVLKDNHRQGVVQLGAAIPNPELLPVDKLNRALCSITRKYRVRNISYEFQPGCEELRVQIARRALTAGCAINPDDIVITSGCQEAIIFALRVICKPGDIVAIESPTYYNFLQAIETLGLKALEIPAHPITGINIDTLRYAIEQHTIKACLFIPNFNNPLGCCMPDDKKKELAEMLEEYGIPLIEDDIYGDLSYSYQRPKVVKAFDKTGNIILCSSFSKTIAPGYRVGWTAAGKFKDEIARLKSISNLATATPPQLAMAEFLSNGGYDHHLRNIRRAYAKNMSHISETVIRYFPEGTKVSCPSGGHVLWIEMPSHIDSLELYEKAIKKKISFAPGPIFSSCRKYGNFLRLNAAVWNETVSDAIKTIGKLSANF